LKKRVLPVKAYWCDLPANTQMPKFSKKKKTANKTERKKMMNLERADLLQVEPISFRNTLKLLPVGKKNKVRITIFHG
jgi:hypothetical protein